MYLFIKQQLNVNLIFYFFKFNKHLLKKKLYETKLKLHHSTYTTRHHSTYYITVLIGLVTFTYSYLF